MKKLTGSIYLPFEFNDINNYIHESWNVEALNNTDINLFDIFYPVFIEAVDVSKYSFDQLYFYQLLEYWKREHNNYDNWVGAGTNLTKQEFENRIQDDGVNQLISNITLALGRVENTINSSLEVPFHIKSLTKEILDKYPAIKDIYPKETTSRENFRGHELQLRFSSPPVKALAFPDLITFEAIKHNEEEGFSPLECLVSAVFFQCMKSQKHNISLDMLSELKKIVNMYNRDKYRISINPETKFHFDVFEPPLQCVAHIINNNDEKQFFEPLKPNKFTTDYKATDLSAMKKMLHELNNRTQEELQIVEDRKLNIKAVVNSKLK